MPTATLIIYKSTDDCQTWGAILPAKVPDWLKAPDIVAHMVDGVAFTRDDDPDTWYIALRAPDESAIEDSMIIAAAKAKRIRRVERNKRALDAELELFKPKNLGPFLSGVQTRLMH